MTKFLIDMVILAKEHESGQEWEDKEIESEKYKFVQCIKARKLLHHEAKIIHIFIIWSLPCSACKRKIENELTSQY